MSGFRGFRMAGLCLAGWMALSLGPSTASAGSFKPAPANGVPDVYMVVLVDGVASKPEGPRKALPTVAQVAQELGRAHGGRVEEVWEDALHGFVIRMPEVRARKLAEDPRVLVVEQDFAVSAPVGDCYYGTPSSNTRPLPSSTVSPQTLSCSDPDPINDSSPTGPPKCLDNWGIDRIDQTSVARDERYYFTNNGRNPSTTVHIYVLDTGIRRTHREFLDANGASRVVGGADARANPVNDSVTADTGDCYGHGTHVAGIIGGRTYGVAKNAILHPVRIIGCTNPDQTTFVSALTRALNWISGHVQRPAVINWSGGNTTTTVSNTTVGTAVQGVLDQGIVLVQAAGNRSPGYDPAQPALLRDACDLSFGEKYPGVIVAGGIDEYDGRWTRRPSLDPDDASYCGIDCGSNAGACVDIWAPAAHVISANMNGDALSCRLSGTSMAAPHVTGVVALYLEDHPNATIAEVEKALRSRGTWNALKTGATDPNSIGPSSDNVVVYSDTLSLGPDLPPTATFTATCQGRSCSFSAAGSTDDGGITSYSWQFGDGSSGSGTNPSHTFPPGFNGRVTLRVTDAANHTDHFSKMVAVEPVAKDALFLSQSVPASMVAGGAYPVSITFRNVGTESWSPIGPQCSAYRLGSTNPYNNTTWGVSRAELPAAVAPGGEVTLSFTVTAPSSPGTYNFQWRMLQECVTWFGDLTSNVGVTVTSPPPTARFTFSCSFLSCSFDAGGSTDDVGIASYTWSFGDGSPNGSGVTTSHVYSSRGSYTVTLTVTDIHGVTGSTKKRVTVTDEPIAPAEAYFPVAPCRIHDSRNAPNTILTSNQPRLVDVAGLCGIPISAKAVSFTVTAVAPTDGGHLVFYPGDGSPGPTPTINFSPATSPRTNNAILRIGGNGRLGILPFVLGTPGQVHVVLDVQGYFGETSGGLGFQTVTPCRVADTRVPSPNPLTVGAVRSFTVKGGSCGVPADASAASLNLTVAQPTGGGHVTLFPAGSSVPLVSAINFNGGIGALANGARVNLASGTPDLSAQYISQASGATAHVILDVNGYFHPTAPLKYRPITACRAVDTRFADQGSPVLAHATTRSFQIQGNCGVPVGAKAAVLNVTAVGPTAGGHLTLYPSGIPAPGVGTINFDLGESALANGAIVPLGPTVGSDLSVFTVTPGGGTHLVVDVFGYFQ